MSLDPQLVTLIEAVGPSILAAFGFLLATASTIIGFLLKRAWEANDARLSQISKTLKALADGILEESKANHTDHRRVWEAVQGLRVELEISRRGMEVVKSSIGETNGAVKTQQTEISRLVEKLAVVSTELKAVFRFIDAPRRATDP